MQAKVLVLPLERMRAGRVRLSERLAAPIQAETASPAPRRKDLAERLHFWRGASDRAYPHTVYELHACPPIPAANYVLVRRGATGRRDVLDIGRVNLAAPTLNLAEMRRRAASLGADEIHLHLLALDDAYAEWIEHDLKAAGHQARQPSPLALMSSRAARE